MSKNQRTVFVGLAIMTIVAMVLFFIFQPADSNQNWEQHYRHNTEDPFGTEYLFKMLNGYEKVDQLVQLTDSLKTDIKGNWKPEKGSYLFLGRYPYYSTGDIDVLIENVSSGSNAFIIAANIPEALVTQLYPNSCHTGYYDEFGEPLEEYWAGYSSERAHSITVNFWEDPLALEEDLVFQHREKNKLQREDWPYVTYSTFCNQSGLEFEVLGYLNEQLSNFIRIPLGEGFIYLHTNPLLFSNYQMAK
ncbi:MAG: hypothetical protein AAFV80_14890, partial [Bacteroidota bacterium]